jgi:hypothetical protein
LTEAGAVVGTLRSSARGIMPAFDAPRRQALCLDALDQRRPLGGHTGIARQLADGATEGIEQGGFG